MHDLKYAIFFLIAFSVIGYEAIQAWHLWDARIVKELEAAAVLR